MSYLADTMKGDFLFEIEISTADCYLFVMLVWAKKNSIDVPAERDAVRERVLERPAVRKAMTHEGLM